MTKKKKDVHNDNVWTEREKIYLTKKIHDTHFRKIYLKFLIKTANEEFLTRPIKHFGAEHIEVSKMSKDIWISRMKRELPMLLRKDKQCIQH